MKDEKREVIKIAQRWLNKNPVYLDTETTGLGPDAEIVQLALLDSDGSALIDTLIKPTIEIEPGAQAVHNISAEAVNSAPTFAEVLSKLAKLIKGRLVIIYNADFDKRLLDQSADAHNMALPDFESVCAMKLYAIYHGDWNDYHDNFRWQSQDKAARQMGIPQSEDLHRAATDAALCRLIVMAMASDGSEFVKSFTAQSEAVYQWARRKGFWDGDRNDGEMIALIHSELSEALEAIRHGNPPDDKIPEFSGYEAELADAIIRIMDLAVGRGLRVGEAIVAKMEYNETRPHKHGKEF